MLAISETMNFHIWATNLAPVTYLSSTVLFVAGPSIVRAHNHWTRGWPVLVTLAGWVAILGGLFRMFAPEARQVPANAATYVGMMVLLAIGVFLTFQAYRREGGKAAAR
jgi:hypothetical protein